MAMSSASLLNITMLSICIFFFSLPSVVLSAPNYSTFSAIQMPPGVTGPESAGFNSFGIGPYTTVNDGRVLKRLPLIGFVDFAYTSPNRTKALCDGTNNPDLGPTCGRPLALSFDYRTGFLYIVDVYYGLLRVGPIGGLAEQVAREAEGVPFKFLTGIDCDLTTGNVYFQDASLNFDIRNAMLPQFRNDATGRFMKYDPRTRQVTVLLRNLKGGGGPAVSRDGSYVLVPEFFIGGINKYWLSGPMANTAEQVLVVAGNVNKIKRAGAVGEYWVANILSQTHESTTVSIPRGLRINGNGMVLQTVSFEAQYYNKTISLVQEQNGELYVGSRLTDSIGKYSD